jgi:hypothetical protein
MALTELFDSAWSNFVLNATQVMLAQNKMGHTPMDDSGVVNNEKLPLFMPEDEDHMMMV